MSIQIIEENPDFLVLFKPNGVSIHNEKPSLTEFLTTRNKPMHFVSRLDAETSGLVLVAKKPEYHEELSESLLEGKKYYRALLSGKWKGQTKTGTWSWPISDQAEGFSFPQGKKADQVSAQTDFEVLRTNDYFTEVQIELLSGRQHQIRKHTRLANQAIVGDPRYGNKKYNDKISTLYKVKRMHLQAERIVFNFKNKDYDFNRKYDLNLFFT